MILGADFNDNRLLFYSGERSRSRPCKNKNVSESARFLSSQFCDFHVIIPHIYIKHFVNFVTSWKRPLALRSWFLCNLRSVKFHELQRCQITRKILSANFKIVQRKDWSLRILTGEIWRVSNRIVFLDVEIVPGQTISAGYYVYSDESSTWARGTKYLRPYFNQMIALSLSLPLSFGRLIHVD